MKYTQFFYNPLLEQTLILNDTKYYDNLIFNESKIQELSYILSEYYNDIILLEKSIKGEKAKNFDGIWVTEDQCSPIHAFIRKFVTRQLKNGPYDFNVHIHFTQHSVFRLYQRYIQYSAIIPTIKNTKAFNSLIKNANKQSYKEAETKGEEHITTQLQNSKDNLTIVVDSYFEKLTTEKIEKYNKNKDTRIMFNRIKPKIGELWFTIVIITLIDDYENIYVPKNKRETTIIVNI